MLTLAEYQSSEGVERESQIQLIDNPALFEGFTPSFYPWWRIRNRARKYPMECLKRRLRYDYRGFATPSNLSTDQVFAGSFDRSFDDLTNLRHLYAHIRTKPHQKFKIIVGKGDYSFSGHHAAEVPDNVIALYANNVCVEDPRIRFVPVGRDFRSAHLFDSQKPTSEKTSICYCNFSVSTHPVRPVVHQALLEKPFVSIDHMGNFLDYSLSRRQFFAKLAKSMFSVCPRGNGVDTFRLWDSLYVGTVPIVVREADFHAELHDLPILFLDRYEDFGDLTDRFLTRKYESMLGTHYNYTKLRAEYWLPIGGGPLRDSGTP